MDLAQVLIQLLNGVQYGLLLFLVASGLTLVFGIMGVINLAHGAFTMLGAYLAWWLTGLIGDLFLAVAAGTALMLAFGLILERLFIARLYGRDHLEQVLLTFALILILDDAQRLMWGSDFHAVAVPPWLAGSLPLTADQDYPAYRLFVALLCLLVGAALSGVIARTRLGMRLRATAADRTMAEAMGIDVRILSRQVFALGVALAAFAGMIGAPISSVYPGMGDRILIVSFVVVVIGGLGSVKGAFVGALLIGLGDTFGKVLVPQFASMVVYGLMAAVLLWRPHGLFGRPA